MTQTRRHRFIVSLLGIRHVVVAVNKMDLVGYSRGGLRADQGRLHRLRRQARHARRHLHPDVGAEGRQRRRPRATRCRGTPARRCCDHLETVHIASDRNLTDLRFPVQYVIRPNLDFRGFCRHGRVRHRPQGRRGHGAAVGQAQPGEVDRDVRRRAGEAFAPHGGDGDARRTRSTSAAATCWCTRTTCRTSSSQFEAMVVWMAEEPLVPGRTVPAQAHHAAGRRRGRRVPLPRRRQHPGAARPPHGWG